MSEDAKEPAPRGRPIKNTMPNPIPDTAENIARAIMRRSPKKNWAYMKAAKEQKANRA